MFTAGEIEAITTAAVTATDLRNWVRQELFNTPLEPPHAGKPRYFPLAAVREAMLLHTLSRAGVPLAIAKSWNQKIIEIIAQVPESENFDDHALLIEFDEPEEGFRKVDTTLIGKNYLRRTFINLSWIMQTSAPRMCAR